ncbi:hypothetical protein [Novosphingobium sp. P6W]|uniref:hypothetical protein n=1 Tax=Novosphingobium sp. P6W TaxID=1609758 RepID=UPI0005C5A6AF|nr:hypothetical protein [Novosphingobium sp. P6W]AXB80181.1 hypothetical protein TQ38_026675 [Novosphingobium sp. P6W]
MVEATWNDEAKTPEIDWKASAALQNVPRGSEDLTEVTSLEGAVRAWLVLDAKHRANALLTPDKPILFDGASMEHFSGKGIAALAEHLPDSQ